MITSRRKVTSLQKISPFTKSELRGEDGAHGHEGPQGERGFKGDTGPKGDQGERGVQGLKGEQGEIPQHRWDGTKLSFQLPNGEWGEYIELRGATGEDGETPQVPMPQLFRVNINTIKGLRAELNALKDSNMQYDKLIDTVDTIKYIGEAIPGTASSAVGWRIKKVDLSDPGGDIQIVWADNVTTFTKVWDDRATYTYTVPA